MEGKEVAGHKTSYSQQLRPPKSEELGTAGLIWEVATRGHSPRLQGRVDKAHGNPVVIAATLGKELRNKADAANKDFKPGPWASLRHDRDSQDRSLLCEDGKRVKAHSALLKEMHAGPNSAVIEHYLDILYGTTNALVISESERQELRKLALSEGQTALAEMLAGASTKAAKSYPHQALVLLSDLAKFQHQGSEEERINAAFVAQPVSKLRDDTQSHDLVIRCSDGELSAHAALIEKAGLALPEEGPLELKYDTATVGRFLDLLYGTKKTMELNEEQLESLRALCLDAGKDWLVDVEPGLTPDLSPYNLSAILADGKTGDLTIRTLTGTVRAHASLFGLQPGEILDLRPIRQDMKSCLGTLHAIYTASLKKRWHHDIFTLIDAINHLPPPVRPALRSVARASLELYEGLQPYWIEPDTSADRVRTLLDLGVDVHGPLDLGMTPLQLAASKGATAWIVGLLNAGADPWATTKEDPTPPLVQLARVKNADLSAFNALLETEDLENPKYSLFSACLKAATKRGNSAIVARLHEVLPQKFLSRFYKGTMLLSNPHDRETRQTRLHTSVQKGKMKAVRDYIELGDSVNWQDAKGETPLHLAARTGNKEILTLLLNGKEKPKLYLENLEGKTAAQVAKEAGHPKLAEKLKSRLKVDPAPRTPPASTIRNNISDNEKVILVDSEGNEHPVHQAFFRGSFVDEFEPGATIPLAQFDGETLEQFLNIAYSTHEDYLFSPRLLRKVHDLAEFLSADAIADALKPQLKKLGEREDGYPNLVVTVPLGLLTPRLEGTEAEKSLLGDAIPKELQFPSTMKLLRQLLYTGTIDNFSYTEVGRLAALSGFLPQVSKDWLQPGLHKMWDRLPHASPLILAINEGNEEVVLPLIEFETEIDRADPEGNVTALALAAERGRTDWINALLKKGADPSRSIEGGVHPIVLAARGGHLNAFMTLLPKSVPEENPGAFLQRCIHNASHGGSREIVLALRERYPLEQLYSDKKQGFDVAHELFEDPTRLKNLTIKNLHDPETLDSLLHAAVREGNREAFVALAERGYDLNWENLKGEKPIDLADEGFRHFITWWQLERARS